MSQLLVWSWACQIMKQPFIQAATVSLRKTRWFFWCRKPLGLQSVGVWPGWLVFGVHGWTLQVCGAQVQFLTRGRCPSASWQRLLTRRMPTMSFQGAVVICCYPCLAKGISIPASPKAMCLAGEICFDISRPWSQRLSLMVGSLDQ